MPVVGPILKFSIPLGGVHYMPSQMTKETKPIDLIIRSEVHYEDIFNDNNEEEDYYN
jgi:hypothetical protein